MKKMNKKIFKEFVKKWGRCIDTELWDLGVYHTREHAESVVIELLADLGVPWETTEKEDEKARTDTPVTQPEAGK